MGHRGCGPGGWVARTTGHDWSRGEKIYRRGLVTGFVPALERLAVREISLRYLSQDERIEIADLRVAGLGVRRIADRLGRAPSAISRELVRNATAAGCRPFEAHRRATARRARGHRRRIETSGELREVVAEFLARRRSPQQISRQLRLRFPGQPAMWLCHESTCQAIYQPGSLLQRPSPLAPHQRSPLRTGRDHRRDYFPKGTDLSIHSPRHSPRHLLAVENELGNRPRRVLGDRTPAELFAALLASENSLCCDVN